MGFAVDALDDVVRALEANGARVVTRSVRAGGACVVLEDMDGHVLELTER